MADFFKSSMTSMPIGFKGPPFLRAGDSPQIDGTLDGAVDHTTWLIFEGRYEDYAVTHGELRNSWSVTAPGGIVYQVKGVHQLKFDDKVVADDVAFAYEVEGRPEAFLTAAGLALALTRGLLGQPAGNDPVLLGQVAAYVDALGLPVMLERLEVDGTLASLAGSTDTDALLALVYSNLSGESADAQAMPALHAEIDARMVNWPEDTPLTLVPALTIALQSSTLALALAQESGPLVYHWFDQPLQGTDSTDYIFASIQVDPFGRVFDLKDGLDSASFSGSRSDYTVMNDEDSVVTVHHDASDMTWTLHDVERLSFLGGEHIAFDLEGSAGQAARLIGMSLGAEAIRDGELVADVLHHIDAQGFHGTVQWLVDKGVFAQLAGGDTLESLLSLLYRNITGAGPSLQEMAWTLDWFHAQQLGATDAILYAAALPQTAALIGLPELAQQGWEYGFGVSGPA